MTRLESPWLNIGEAAEYMRLKPGTVYDMVESGRLKCGRAGNRLRFRIEDLDGFLLESREA